MTGSITVDHSRLPVWCFIETALGEGWQSVEENWPSVRDYQWDAWRLGRFLYDLLESRGEFGRLICILADVERRERERLEATDKEEFHIIEEAMMPPAWWQMPEERQRVIDQLRRCLEALENQ